MERAGPGVAGVPKSLRWEEKRLTEGISALTKDRRKTPKDKDPERHKNLTAQIQKAETEFKALVKNLQKRYPVYAGLKYPLPMTLEKTALRPNEHVLI